MGRKVINLVLIISLIIFCYSGFRLYTIWNGYHQGAMEYEQVKNSAVEEVQDANGEELFLVNFDELMRINPDTVGWIRFSPEPAQINYPLVHTDNNDIYLSKTFSDNDNTVGAIFVNCYNHADFKDQNTIIYGHRMKDNSMFHDLEKYKEKSFWENNPYFYIYTPEGKELTYHIYSAGVVKDVSDTYLIEFGSKEEFERFVNITKESSVYDTGVVVKEDDKVVTLSTCTADSNDERMVVQGVLIQEKEIKK